MAGLFFSMVDDAKTKRNFDHIASVINPVIANLGPGLGNAPTWVAPALNTGWVNLATTASGTANGSTAAAAGYNLDATGRVSLKGILYNSSGGNLTGTLYTLRAGYRPRELRVFACAGYDGVNAATYFVDIFPTGVVSVAGTVPSVGYVSVEISFQAEQ